MVYSTPQQILPKFLWKYIIDYVSYNNIHTLIRVNSHFAKLIDDDDGRESFLESRINAIVIIKCKSNRMKYFWKYAQSNYRTCNDIDDIFYIIRADDNIKLFYHKVFIKQGHHIASKYHYYCDIVLHNLIHNIEIVGSHNNSTVIAAHHSLPYNNNCQSIYYTGNISIKNITFSDIQYKFVKRVNYHVVFYDIVAPTLSISNCIFINHSDLSLENIYDISLLNCRFNNSRLLTNNCKIEPIQYNISHNIFTNIKDGAYIYCIGNICLSSIINITKNTFDNKTNDSISLLSNNLTAGTIAFSNNRISDIKSCIKYACHSKSIVIFSNNTFNHVSKLYDNTWLANIKLNSDNIFVNCDAELTQHIEK